MSCKKRKFHVWLSWWEGSGKFITHYHVTLLFILVGILESYVFDCLQNWTKYCLGLYSKFLFISTHRHKTTWLPFTRKLLILTLSCSLKHSTFWMPHGPMRYPSRLYSDPSSTERNRGHGLKCNCHESLDVV